jgi:hypothetical protein
MIRKDTDTKNLRKTILKFSKDIPIVGERHRGVFSITGYRVYNSSPNTSYVEVDVVFKGEIKVSVYSFQEDSWLSPEIKKNKNYRVSPVKLGRFLRNKLFKEVNNHMGYFDTKITNEYSIKTIKWI